LQHLFNGSRRSWASSGNLTERGTVSADWMQLPWLASTVHAHIVTALNVDSEYNKGSSEDKSYTQGNDGEETLGLHDTDIDDDEVQDLEADAKMPPKNHPLPRRARRLPRRALPRRLPFETWQLICPKWSSPNTKLKPNFIYELPPPFPWTTSRTTSMFSSAPPSSLKYCRVLPGGRQLALLVAFPRWANGKKLLELQMGIDYNTESACKHVPSRWLTMSPQTIPKKTTSWETLNSVAITPVFLLCKRFCRACFWESVNASWSNNRPTWSF
jgi:hypothetical protein